MDENTINPYSIKYQKMIMKIPEDMVILKEGEVNLDMYRLVEGHVEMYTDYGTDKEVLIGVLGPGACFGEFGLLLKKPAIYTIKSFSEIKVLRVTEGLLSDFIRDYPGAIVQIMRNMANMMMCMQHNLNQLSTELAEVSAQLPVTVNMINTESASESITMERKEMLRKYVINGFGNYSRKE